MRSGDHSARISIGGLSIGLDKTTNVSISLPQNAGESGQLEFFSDAETDASSVALTALLNGAAVASGSWSFGDSVSPKTGSDGPLNRVRGVSLRDFTTRWNALVGNREGLGLPPLPPRYQPVVYDLDKPLGSDLPDGAECEEKARSSRITAPVASDNALSVAGMAVKLIPGPGYVTRPVDDEYSTAGKTVGQVLNELLFTNGVRWWVEGDLVVVDGSALPSGAFTVPAADKDEVEDTSFGDEFTSPEPAPKLSDYIARCAESIITDSGAEGTFETNPDGEQVDIELSGTQGPDGDYTRTEKRTVKQAGRITTSSSISFGYLTTPSGRTIGRTQQTGLENLYHTAVPEALIGTIERTYTYADYGLLQNLEGGGEGETELQKELWPQLLARSPYISSEKITQHRYNAEGMLRATTESTREFSNLVTLEGVNGRQLEFLYKDSTQTETYLPYGGGRYWLETEGYDMVDTAIYEGDAETGLEPVGIMAVRRPFSSKRPSDGPPPSVSIPLPTCEEMNTCLVDAQREFSRDYADWEARQVNNVSKRRYSVRFGCLKLNLQRGQLWGGGYVESVTHSVNRSKLSTTVDVLVALE